MILPTAHCFFTVLLLGLKSTFLKKNVSYFTGLSGLVSSSFWSTSACSGLSWRTWTTLEAAYKRGRLITLMPYSAQKPPTAESEAERIYKPIP